MTGTLIDHTLYDSRCTKPIEGDIVPIFVQGFDETMEVPKESIIKVICGKCDFMRGVERA